MTRDIAVSKLESLPSGHIKVIDEEGETLYQGLLHECPFNFSEKKGADIVYMAAGLYEEFLRTGPKPTRTERYQ